MFKNPGHVFGKGLTRRASLEATVREQKKKLAQRPTGLNEWKVARYAGESAEGPVQTKAARDVEGGEGLMKSTWLGEAGVERKGPDPGVEVERCRR